MLYIFCDIIYLDKDKLLKIRNIEYRRGKVIKVLSDKERLLLEKELRRGTSRSRIANLLHVDYDTAVEKIEQLKLDIRPEVGRKIVFVFRGCRQVGVIVKLLSNSAVVDILWEESDTTMRDICRKRTIVNYMDIKAYIID